MTLASDFNKKGNMRIVCPVCKKDTEHKVVSDDKSSGKFSDDSWRYSCRGVRSNYMTVQCQVCKKKNTYDFAGD